MAEYIRRDAAIEAAKHAWAKGLEPSQYIEALPAADVAPVVYGHWICEWDQESGTTTITCSQCKCNRVMKGCYVSTDGTALWDEENYCPDCGAKMDGGADHEAD